MGGEGLILLHHNMAFYHRFGEILNFVNNNLKKNQKQEKYAAKHVDRS